MKSKLKSKIDYYDDTFTTRFEKTYSINFTDENINRDSRSMLSLVANYKEWLLDIEKSKYSFPENISALIVSYFIDKEEDFELLFTQDIVKVVKSGDAKNVNDYINMLAMAIAHENLNKKVSARLIEVSTNSSLSS